MHRFAKKAVPVALVVAATLSACSEGTQTGSTPAEQPAATQTPATAEPITPVVDSRSQIGSNQLDMYMSDARIQNWQGIGTRDGNRLISNATNGFLMFGPKVPFDAGSYQVTIYGERVKIGKDNSITFDVTSNEGKQVYAKKVLDQTASVAPDAPLATFTFSLPEPVTDLEVRAYVTSGSEVTITRYEVKPASSP
jgi:hypothetical protein